MALGEGNWFPSWQLSQGQGQNPGALNVGHGLEPNHRIIKVEIHFLASQSQTINPASLYSPLNHISKCHIHMYFEHF